MPDTPNFVLIAREIASTLAADPSAPDGDIRAVADRLRAIWNARGEADVATIRTELAQIGVKATAHLKDTLDTAVHALDR
jgi:succinate dehydrogenase/fumarate reductase flavoprotein subunit